MSCLDEDTVALFVGGRMAHDEIPRVETHARGCPDCRELISLAFAAASVSPVREAEASPETAAGHPKVTPGRATMLVRGTSFGRYTILGPLGRGAMGEVYAAFDPELDRKVALKILHVHGQGADAGSRSRLLREAKALAKLRHPNVVVVFDAGTLDDQVFLAMEYVDGQTLAGWLAEQPRTRREILAVFLAAGRGLGAAHAAGLVHRDFKPQNVMVEKDGGVRVMDFGLARQIDKPDPPEETAMPSLPGGAPDVRITRTGELIGTPLYMAPEQFRTQRADARSDQFSFCVALYQALYGAHPFGGQRLLDLASAVTKGQVLPPPSKSTVPLRMRRLLLRGLSVDPSARWESMEVLTAALSRDPARQRRRWLAGAALAGVLIAGFVAARAPRTAESICRGGPARLAGVWEPDDGKTPATSRRAATRAAFVETRVASAADTWDRAARMLDRYTADWLRMYVDTCAATQLRGEQSAEVLDLRMDCLRERLGRVKALTDVFVNANVTVVENAVQAAGGLPTLDRCADVTMLRAVMPPPEDPKARARLESLRLDLARVRALGASGQCGAAATAEQTLIAAADELGYLPLVAESLISSNRSPGCPHETVLQNSRRAVLVGLASHHQEVTAEAAIHLAQMTADRTPDVARAREWIDMAGALMQGMSGTHPVLEAWRIQALALVYAKEGNDDKALDAFERARALTEKTQGPEHTDYANIINNIGVFFFDRKRYEEALVYYRRGAELAATVSGPDHSLVALAHFNSAEALNALHRYDEARVAAERALAIWRHAGSGGFYLACASTILGQAFLEQGNERQAATHLEEAVRLFQDDGSSHYPLAARFALARALWPSAAERPRARALAREAKAGYQRLGNLASEVAKVDSWSQAHDRPKRGDRD